MVALTLSTGFRLHACVGTHLGSGSDIAPDTTAACPNPKAVLQVTGQDDLPQRFAALKRRASTRRGEPRPTLDLAWVPLTDILDPATRCETS